MAYNPSIYEINIRVFLRRFSPELKLHEIPDSFWDMLMAKRIEYVWLMGVWETSASSVEKYCFEPDLVKEYDKALKNWQKEDVIGSPFAIDIYEVNKSYGGLGSLTQLKKKLNKRGIKLILDFVPNHFNADTRLLLTHPEIFLSVDKKSFLNDPHTYFQPDVNEEKYFAHGRDPFFPAWQDTVQVNFFSIAARKFLNNILMQLIKICDGVRCDMAMLALNNVFKNTWAGALARKKIEPLTTEFWTDLISDVKKERNDFLFIAEAYWDLEWELQQLGFDYSYDKRLTDRLKSDSAISIKEHLNAEIDFLYKSLRFIENHDEERAVTVMGKEKSKAAAIIISTIPGMRFYFSGQFEGKRIKLPIQLGREPDEVINTELVDFYNKLFSIVREDVFKKGDWKKLNPLTSWEGNNSFKNFLAWHWALNQEKRIVVVNYSNLVSTCRLKIDVREYPEIFELKDLLNNQNYLRSAEEVYHTGLYIELKPWQSHIFHY
ncbi:MAG: alpha-amylase family glycosyl hydrolase [Bacteroidota bacterium]